MVSGSSCQNIDKEKWWLSYERLLVWVVYLFWFFWLFVVVFGVFGFGFGFVFTRVNCS